MCFMGSFTHIDGAESVKNDSVLFEQFQSLGLSLIGEGSGFAAAFGIDQSLTC